MDHMLDGAEIDGDVPMKGKKDEDGKKDKKDKKKYKTKAEVSQIDKKKDTTEEEEQMDQQIEELSRQLTEEKHNSRRERLTVTRLQRELNQAKKDNSAKDSLMRDLSKERQSRLEAERQLKEVLLESETCKSRLESLQKELGKMQATMNTVMEYQNNLEQLKQEKNCLVHKYENDLEKCHTRISNLERENSSLTNEIRNLEAKMTHDDSVKERALLVDRLKQLEAENSALVLENENQRRQYERCLDEVANQVVQALLMQKDLREECLKLHNRVQELEQQNRNLKCVFDCQGVSLSPNSVPQPSFPHNFGSPSSPHHTGSLFPSSQHPCTVTSRGHNKPVGSQGSDQLSGSMYNNSGNSGVESYLAIADKMRQQHNVPSSDNVAYSSRYTSQHHVPSLQPGYRPAVLQGSNSMHLSSHGAFVAQTCSMDRYRFQMSSAQHNGDAQRVDQDRRPQYNYQGVTSSNYQPTVQTSYRFTLASVRTNEVTRSPQAKPLAPHQRYSPDDSCANPQMGMVNGQQESTTPSSNGHSSPVSVQSKVNGHPNGELRNGYVLSDKYSKPYVHAPFHYAQSLLQELQEISSSVKSFESLTLQDPKPGTQQKRKAEAPHNNGNSRQKLVKGQITLPLERDNSIESDLGDCFATMPELLDTSTSSLSSASVETALEGVVSLSPTPLSPSWTDEGDTLEISLDDQILDSSMEKDSDQLLDSSVEKVSDQFLDSSLEKDSDQILDSSLEKGDDIDELDESVDEADDVAATKVVAEDSNNALCDDTTEMCTPEMNDTDTLPCKWTPSSKEKDKATSPAEDQKPEKPQVLLSPRKLGKLCTCSATRGNWPHKEQYNCKVNELEGQQHLCKDDGDDKKLCNLTSRSTSASCKPSSPVSAKLLGASPEINSNCLSVSNKMQNVNASKPCPNRHVLRQCSETQAEKSRTSTGLGHRRTASGPHLYPLSPCDDMCCPSGLICSGPLCTAQKRQMQQQESENNCSPLNNELSLTEMSEESSKNKTSPNRTKSTKELAENIAMTQVNYATKAEVSLGNRNRSKTESWVKTDTEQDLSTVVSSLDVIPTPCVVLRSPVKSKMLVKDLTNSTDSTQMPCTAKDDVTAEETFNNEEDESTSKQVDTMLPSNISASSEDQTSSASFQKSEYQKTPYENRIGSFITPSQEDIPPMSIQGSPMSIQGNTMSLQGSPKKSSYVKNLDDSPVVGVVATEESSSPWKNNTQPLASSLQHQRTSTDGDKEHMAASQTRSRSLGRNEAFPISGFIKEDNIKIKKTKSLDRDSCRTPSPRRHELSIELPKSDASPRMLSKKTPTKLNDSKLDIKTCTTQKPSSLQISLSNNVLLHTKKETDVNQPPATDCQESRKPESLQEHQVQGSRGITEELIQFRSNSLGENPFLNSVSMESLQSDNSDDWGSPSKSTDSDKKAATPLSEFLSSDSDSEEENINFVEMWKARDASPMKLPEWNPQKSVEEHRKKMRESLSYSNRSSNLEKSSSLSSSTSSEQWLLSYPFTSTDASPVNKAPSPVKQSHFLFDKSAIRRSASVGVTNGDDDVFIIENGPPTLSKFNSLESRKSTTSSGRSSLGENSVMYDFVSSILDELGKDGVVKVQPGSPIKKQNGPKMSKTTVVDKLTKDKEVIQNGQCIVEVDTEDVKCNSENMCNQINESLQDQQQCNRAIELRPTCMRTFSLDSSGITNSNGRQSPVGMASVDGKDKRTNSPSRIPKATKRGTSHRFSQSLWKITHPQRDHDSVNGEEKKKESKVKTRIPQLIRDSFKSAISQAGHSRKRDRFPKVDIIRKARSLPVSPLLGQSPKLSPSPKLNCRPRLSTSSNEDQPKSNESPILSPSPKSSPSPCFSKSPRLCASPRMAGSPLLNRSPFSDSTDSIGGTSCNGSRHSRKPSVASTSSFIVDDVPFIDDSGSSPESQTNQSNGDCRKYNQKSEMQIGSPITTPYRGISHDELPNGFLSRGGNRTNGGLDDQISPEMIEDIKQGRLASNWDSLSLGVNQSKASHHDLKNAYSWSENLSTEVETAPTKVQVQSAPAKHPIDDEEVEEEKEVTISECVGRVENDYEEEAEAESCSKVPLVDEEMMENFEVEDDICADEDTASIRENAAQLTERERANLLDSLFDTEDSSEGEEDSYSHSDSMSSADSHPGEREFMRMLGDKNKALKHHQVIRHHSAIYCRVSIMQVDVSHLYTRFGEKEKEALASFDFLRAFDDDVYCGYPDHNMSMNPRSHHHQGIRLHELESSDDDHLCYNDPMMQDDASLTGSSDQEPGLAAESMILSDIMGDSFSSSTRYSYSSTTSSNSLSSQN